MKPFSLILTLILISILGCAPAGGPAKTDGPMASPAASPVASPTPEVPKWQAEVGDLADAAAVLATPESMAKIDWPAEKRAMGATILFKNVKVLQDVDGMRFMAAMHGFTRALGSRCIFCHDTDDFPSDGKEQKKTARKMLFMNARINHELFDDAARVTCWTCHHGESKGETEPDEGIAKRAAKQVLPPGLAIAGADAKKPASAVFKNLQILGAVPAGELPHVMQRISASLGVNCAHCHVDGKWESDEKKNKDFARAMMRMTAQSNALLSGDEGSITCWTCHRGEAKPDKLPEPGDE